MQWLSIIGVRLERLVPRAWMLLFVVYTAAVLALVVGVVAAAW